ncbi:ABC transporter permease [Neobacillus sp. FSL H8-0543]|uniref:ABC transporter permease n=1 Tax=Neobacillus sp. FSL H8-0543 TaxID=2954672 RepID=UPI003158727F
MNIINKVTVRHLKENKRRTLVTIIGVIISVAMVTAVATLGVSFLDLFKRQSIATDGEWHVQYKNVNSEQIAEIERDKDTKKLAIKKDLGYASLPNSQNESKPYLYLIEYNEQAFKQFPVTISKGRLPQTENEVVISEAIATNAKVEYQIGDQFTVEIGNRFSAEVVSPLNQNDSLLTDENGVIEELKIDSKGTFKVVGIIERPPFEPLWAPGYTVISYVDQTLIDKVETVDAVVVLNKVSGSLYEHAGQLAKRNKIEKVTYNDDLLRYYGVTDNDNLRLTLFSLAGIIMAVIIIGSVALIYNAFAISVSERSRHLGMLSSVGATKAQKRNSVFFEGAIIGAISIPIGIAAGIGGIAVTFWVINTFLEGALGISEELQVVVTVYSILVACAISILTIFISTYLPARKASKISAIDAIRQTQDVKLSRKAVKTSKLIRKIFGMEAEIGLKNLKRNKRRYQATVFSLGISIVLFLAVTYFTSNLQKSIELAKDDVNYDIQVMGNNGDRDELKSLESLEFITESSIVEQLDLTTWVDPTNISEELKKNPENVKANLKDGKYPYFVVLHGLDEQSFRAYAKKAGADIEKFQDSHQPKAIIIEQTSYQDYMESKFIETNSITASPGEIIELYTKNHDTNEEKYLNKVEIGALTDEVPMGIQTASAGGLDVIVSEKTMHQLINEEVEKDVQPYLYLNSSDPIATQDAIEEVKESDMYVYNVYERRQQDQQLIMLMSIFTYGFIALISLISIANIFNTIS